MQQPSSWKVRYLSLGGRLTLVNSVLSAIPTYWLSLFKIPCWVIKKINRIRRDFLWSGTDIDHPKCRLVGRIFVALATMGVGVF